MDSTASDKSRGDTGGTDSTGDINITPQFVLAGEAVYTVSNGRGEHHTFKVYKTEPTAQFPNPSWFIKVKSGPEEDDWSYVGRVVANPNNLLIDPTIRLTAKSRYKADAAIMRVAVWTLKVVWQVGRGKYRVPPGYSVRHEGKCGRCRRPLTHPASLDCGLGPECAAALGIEWAERDRRQLELEGE